MGKVWTYTQSKDLNLKSTILEYQFVFETSINISTFAFIMKVFSPIFLSIVDTSGLCQFCIDFI